MLTVMDVNSAIVCHYLVLACCRMNCDVKLLMNEIIKTGMAHRAGGLFQKWMPDGAEDLGSGYTVSSPTTTSTDNQCPPSFLYPFPNVLFFFLFYY